jgi:phosphoribosylanthranilate isomerase
MRAPFVKVCGITRAEDARIAVAAGARALGFVFVIDSPRRITPEDATVIVRSLPGDIAKVGVVRDMDTRTLNALVAGVGLTALQLHGDEPPELLEELNVPAIKAFAAGPGFQIERLARYRGFGVLLDGGTAQGHGGTGTPADWSAARAARERGFRVLLAGGLGPANVTQAVREVEPVAIDLNSGVEIAPGRKDRELIERAIHALSSFDPPEISTWPW